MQRIPSRSTAWIPWADSATSIRTTAPSPWWGHKQEQHKKNHHQKGTAVGTVSGDVRGLQIELVSDDAGTRTITGEVNAIRIRAAFSATAITGKFSAIRVEIPETQTNSKTYDYLLDLTGTGTAWSDTDTASGDTEAGFIRVRINGNARRIVTYSDET